MKDLLLSSHWSFIYTFIIVTYSNVVSNAWFCETNVEEFGALLPCLLTACYKSLCGSHYHDNYCWQPQFIYVAGILLAFVNNTRHRKSTLIYIVNVADIGRAHKIVNIPSSVQCVWVLLSELCRRKYQSCWPYWYLSSSSPTWSFLILDYNTKNPNKKDLHINFPARLCSFFVNRGETATIEAVKKPPIQPQTESNQRSFYTTVDA